MPVDPDAPIEINGYAWVPQMARGYVRDLRARWALEEIGLSYRTRLIGGAGGSSGGPARPEDYLAEQPFGQVPVYREGELRLFESGAIVLHIGEKDERLLPRDPAGRGRAIAWMIAALNSIEPLISTLFLLNVAFAGAEWTVAARAAIVPLVEKRLAQLADALGDGEWLDDRFSIGDLMMVDALRGASDQRLITAHENLAAYVERGMARPAFQRAHAAQLADFERVLA